jgi:hypothetical protein
LQAKSIDYKNNPAAKEQAFLDLMFARTTALLFLRPRLHVKTKMLVQRRASRDLQGHHHLAVDPKGMSQALDRLAGVLW